MANKLDIEWGWREFDDLSNSELYQMLQLRQDVFVLEQNCLYADIDGEDYYHWHLLGYDLDSEGSFTGEHLAAYLRLIPPDHHESGCVAIGRVVSDQQYRGFGLGYQLIEQAIQFCDKHFPGMVVFLSAQEHLEDFYKNFGFSTVSEMYLEDDIPHIDMKKIPKFN
ncbi:MAG TPA: GNAT family N-acetyltransferase [Aeromonadales bacterium]|nr:GNAT family N-acetyltransferase [Aeromonadales bacterium]